MVQILLLQVLSVIAACQATSSPSEAQQQQLKLVTNTINYDLASVLQVGSSLVFLANGSISAPLLAPPVNVHAESFANSSTQQALWGVIQNQESGKIVAASITSSQSTFIRYVYDESAQDWLLTTKRGGGSFCLTSTVESDGVSSVSSQRVVPCNPTTWEVYKNVSATLPFVIFPPQVVTSDNCTSHSYPSIILPVSQAIILGEQKVGAVNVNFSLSSLQDSLQSYAQTNEVLYIMTSASDGSILIASSVGEPLSVNCSTVPAKNAQNSIIRETAQYWSSLNTAGKVGRNPSTYTYEDDNSFLFLSTAALYSYGQYYNWVVVSTVLLGTTTQNTTVGVEIGVEVTAFAASILLTSALNDFISYGRSVRFFTQNGSTSDTPLTNPLITLYENPEESIALQSTSQQLLWGLASAYGFTANYESMVVASSTGDFIGYSAGTYFQASNQSCGTLIANTGLRYPGTNGQPCVRIYATTSHGVAKTPANSQNAYNALTTDWYQAANQYASNHKAFLYGIVMDAHQKNQGLSLVLPLYEERDTLSGVVNVFVEETVLSPILSSATNKLVNVTYAIDAAGYLQATSLQPYVQPLVNQSSGQRILAVDSTDYLISFSAKFVAEQAIYADNVFYLPDPTNSAGNPNQTFALEIAVVTITQLQGVDLYWRVISVDLVDVTTATAEVVTIIEATVESSGSSCSETRHYRDATIGVVIIAAAAIITLIAFVSYYWVALRPRLLAYAEQEAKAGGLEISRGSTTENPIMGSR